MPANAWASIMPPMSPDAHPSPAWSLVWLRRGPEVPALRRRLRDEGGHLLELAPWRIVPRRDPASAHALAAALSCPRVLFTSPAAVTAADALYPLACWQPAGPVLAVGSGTARALAAAGMTDVLAPERMDSEGLLCLPALQQIAGLAVGLVTAPGGRGMIPAVLQQRGADVRQADVYDRRRRHLPARRRARLLTLPLPAWLALGSGKALEHLWEQLSPRRRHALQACRAVPASARLAETAARFGLTAGPRAANALASTLLDTVLADRRQSAACEARADGGCWDLPPCDGEPVP